MKNAIKFPLRLISHLLFSFPSCLALIQRAVLNAASAFDLIIAFRLVKRPEWLLLPWKFHQAKLAFLPPIEPTEKDFALAQRIIASYAFAKGKSDVMHPGVESGTIWDTLLQTHYARLHKCLQTGKQEPLANFFSEIFQTETVNGYTNGTTFNKLPHRWWTFALAIEISLVCLAEAVGVARAECPEQGIIGHAMQPNAITLIQKLESYFGFRIEAPQLGAARGVILGGRFLTREVCSQLYTAFRIRQALLSSQKSGPLHFVEIGGGYGGLCLWLHHVLGDRIASYTIVDLPITNVVQAYFLSHTLNDGVELFGETGLNMENINQVKLVPHFALDNLHRTYDVLLNQDSMPELPFAEVERYLKWGQDHIDGLFFSFNQEAYSVVNGTPQVHVADVVSRLSGYNRLSRHTSWDRRGYVEEVYSVGQGN